MRPNMRSNVADSARDESLLRVAESRLHDLRNDGQSWVAPQHEGVGGQGRGYYVVVR